MGDTDISPSSMARMNSEVAAISAKIMVTAMIVLFLMVAFCFFLCLYAKWYWSRNEPSSFTRRGTLDTTAVAQRRGLDRDTLRSLPMVVYDPKEFKELLECSVCLSEISLGEKLRVLPKCDHGFHLECIDMWFMSHSTCPLCRNSVSITTRESQVVVSATPDLSENSNLSLNLDVDTCLGEAPNFPVNNVQVRSLEEGSGSSSRRKDELVIEIPRDLSNDGLSSSPLTTRFREEEVKTPVVSRLGSLKRMLSRGKRVIPSSSTETESVYTI